MTILASFVFASSVLDIPQFKRDCEAMLFADGRISNNNGSNLIVDTAPKLTIQDIRVRTKSGWNLTSKVAIGYAGSSALVALGVLNFTAHVLGQLFGDELPTIDQISAFVGEALKARGITNVVEGIFSATRW